MNIIVTGAGKGIGYEVVRHFTSAGKHNIITVARNSGSMGDLIHAAGESGCNVFPLEADLLEKNVPEKLSILINKHFPKIDIFINNAGLMIKKPVAELSNEDFDRLFATNVKVPFSLIRSLLPFFNENAHIINIGSMGGFQGSLKFTGLSLYSASKGALAILSECLAEELKEKKIFVNCLALGSVQTDMLEETFPGYKAPVNAQEMANFVVKFALNGHHYFNGKIIPVSVTTP